MKGGGGCALFVKPPPKTKAPCPKGHREPEKGSLQALPVTCLCIRLGTHRQAARQLRRSQDQTLTVAM